MFAYVGVGAHAHVCTCIVETLGLTLGKSLDKGLTGVPVDISKWMLARSPGITGASSQHFSLHTLP